MDSREARSSQSNRVGEPVASGDAPRSLPAPAGRRLRVGMVLSRCHPDVGGGTEWQARLLSRALARRGHRVVLFAMNPSNAKPAREEIDGFDLVRIPSLVLGGKTRGGGIGTPFLLWRYASALSGEAGGFDVLHAHLVAMPSAAAALAADRLRTPLLLKLACAGPFGDLATLRAAGWRGYGPILRRLVRRADRVVAMTDDLAHEARSFGFPEGRLVRIPNGVEIPVDDPAGEPDPRAPVIVCVGRLARQKRFDLLVEAVAGIAPRFPGLQVHVYGIGEEREALLRDIARRSLDGVVRLEGVEPRERIYRGASLFVLPSDDEGMSNALLEAMARGLPCLVSDIAANREAAADGAAYFPRGDSSALASRIAALLSDPGEADRLGRKARERATEAFSIDAVAARYEALYASLCAERVRP